MKEKEHLMKLKFKHQQYQDDAVKSLVDCFKGQENGKDKSEIFFYGNKLVTLKKNEIEENIKNVQKRNGISYTKDESLNEFSIEMETGTGKTFTYIKSMYELNKAYGWSKFIVIVPTIAIKEGVKKSFDITQDYFQDLYHKKIRYFIYDSSHIENINLLASVDSIQVMIINFHAFNRDLTKEGKGNVIYKELDLLQSRRPIDIISSINPILILDEPQTYGGETKRALENFNPLFKVRYSATHKKGEEYNKIYKLDAIDAYNQKLVKKIYVKGIEVINSSSQNTYLYLDKVDISKKDPIASLEIEVKSSNGVNKKIIKVKNGDDLYIKSKELQQYKGYIVDNIDGRDNQNKVIFKNGKEIQVGSVFGDEFDIYIKRTQIRETIKSHFEKEKKFHRLNIKVLSLFFIDLVEKYKKYDKNNKASNGEYADIFEEEYNNILNEYLNDNNLDKDYKDYLLSIKDKKVHAGYFAIDKTASKGLKEDEQVFIDTKENTKKDQEKNEEAFNLIMRNKERLLSLEEPVRFIFSHSALKEGWDNPNVFQICTLKKSNSEISKRQEIGRGLRICVNGNGNRMDESELGKDFHSINTLTVIASESYENFSKALQNEIKKDLPDKIFTKFELKHFENEEIGGEKLSPQDVLSIYNKFKEANYIDENYNILPKLKEDIFNNVLQIPIEVEDYAREFVNLVKSLYIDPLPPISNDKNCVTPKLNIDNFNKKEFQELWNKINIKTFYQIKVDTDNLINNSKDAINNTLIIPKMEVAITEGEQKDKIDYDLVNTGTSMSEGRTKTENIEKISHSMIKYDLVGEIVKDTGLTRKTVGDILSKITPEKFNTYKYNPELFIRKICDCINNVKAKSIIDGIIYHITKEKYKDDIFTNNNINGVLDKNVLKNVKKHIYDLLVYDSEVEKEFAKDLERHVEVTVYAKLPNSFKISTPVGAYNPDWAIVLDNSYSKYIYFIIETKGSGDQRGREEAVITCATKHFECISNGDVKYRVVTNYEGLRTLFNSVIDS